MNWSKLLNNSRILLLLIGFGFSSTAQNGLEDYKKQFPDFNEVVLLDYQG